MMMILEIFDCSRRKSSFLKHCIKKATLQCMMCDLLKQWDMIRRCSSLWKETTLLLMKLRETLMRVTVLQISFAFMKTKTCCTNSDRLRCADFCFYTWMNMRAYDTRSWLIISQPLCTGKERFTLQRITRNWTNFMILKMKIFSWCSQRFKESFRRRLKESRNNIIVRFIFSLFDFTFFKASLTSCKHTLWVLKKSSFA